MHYLNFPCIRIYTTLSKLDLVLSKKINPPANFSQFKPYMILFLFVRTDVRPGSWKLYLRSNYHTARVQDCRIAA